MSLLWRAVGISNVLVGILFIQKPFSIILYENGKGKLGLGKNVRTKSLDRLASLYVLYNIFP